jgi:type II secretory pathway pseudopilin PulG
MMELMVVILILATLVSLISSVAVKGMDNLTETQTRKEISEMEVALRAFMSDYGLTEPPPSYLVLNEITPLNTTAQGQGGSSARFDDGQSGAFLEKLFGKNLGKQGFVDWNGDGQPNGPWLLKGNQCLVFYLGGIPNLLDVKIRGASPAPQGFAANNMNPGLAVTQSPKRKGPYFNFVTTRLYYPVQQVFPSWDGFTYLDPWMTKSGPLYLTLGGSPYAFFSFAGIRNQYAHTNDYGAYPYMTGVGQYTNLTTYQIISAGKDGIFASQDGNSGGVLWNPSSGATGYGADDQANFSSTLLGAGQN